MGNVCLNFIYTCSILLFAHAVLVFLDENWLKLRSPNNCLLFFFFHIDIAVRAHQGFGWVGEWANTRLVKTWVSGSMTVCYL